VGDQVAWAAGVVADERFGGEGLERNWIAELKPL
jgi:hypothetical protein